MNAYQHYADSVVSTLEYRYGQIPLGMDLATVTTPEGYKYLDGDASEMILTDLWGNPPSEAEDRSLGMLLPDANTPNTDSSFVINITYSEEGYIDDSDAGSLDYDELLADMKADVQAANPMRVEHGYDPVELIGWASPPFYDAVAKKLHWAKELKFGDAETNTLNYNIRVLGRRGYLELNVIGEMYVLDEVKEKVDDIIHSVNFDEGNLYREFDPKIDKVATYGIGALIAGKLAAKAGLLAKLGIILAKFWKIIALAVIGLGAGLKRFFGGSSQEETQDHPHS